MKLKNIRNFSIIAHIDHGKSTLSDRFLEITGLKKKNSNELVLDNMDLEKERGITIKSQTARMSFKAKDGNEYILNLIDTPGHMDFNYEVSRSLAACEGALLLIDATQGIEAQTIVNYNLALDNNLTIIGVINKIDLPSADVDRILTEIENILIIPKEEVFKTSAKTGVGAEELLQAIVDIIPPPEGELNAPLKALIIDSYYDPFRGVILKTRIFDGEIKAGDKIVFMSSGHSYEVDEVGIYQLEHKKKDKLSAGEVGYIIGGIKKISDVNIGDTITTASNPAKEPLPGFKEMKPMVFAGIFPIDSEKYEDLKVAIEKLKLNDAALISTPYNSPALGFGFRCGFLGLLHLEIVQERIEREFGIEIIATAPNVSYRIYLKPDEYIEITNPADFPEKQKIFKTEEPFVKAIIIVPNDFVGNVMQLMQESRGIYKSTEYLDATRVELIYEVPFAEIIFDFVDRLKSVTKGYASFDYELIGFREAELVKINILVHKKIVDALSIIAHKEKAYYQARKIVSKLREVIPRQLFEVAIQASIGSKVIARESVKAIRKDVTSKCYGGDITRKRKLLEKQKKGKKRMKMIGTVEVPQEAFLSILKVK